MNIPKMATLIMKHPEFLVACYKRQSTSTRNKQLHDVMITAIEAGDRQHVEEALSNRWYKPPLEGVIYCMDTEFDVVRKFIKVFEEDGDV